MLNKTTQSMTHLEMQCARAMLKSITPIALIIDHNITLCQNIWNIVLLRLDSRDVMLLSLLVPLRLLQRRDCVSFTVP